MIEFFMYDGLPLLICRKEIPSIGLEPNLKSILHCSFTQINIYEYSTC